jgi:hypothetical protein
MSVKPKTQWRKGWSRALSNESDKPVTLNPAPWETLNPRAATPQPKKEAGSE